MTAPTPATAGPASGGRAPAGRPSAGRASAVPGPEREIALVDLLDRVLAGGVVVSGEIVLGIADVDLVRISLRALVASIRSCEPGAPLGRSPGGAPGVPAGEEGP